MPLLEGGAIGAHTDHHLEQCVVRLMVDRLPAALALPQDADTFIAKVQADMQEALTQFDRGLPQNPKVRLRTYGDNRIVLTPLEAEPEPSQLGQLKAEVL